MFPIPNERHVVAQLPFAFDVGPSRDHHLCSWQYHVSVPAVIPDLAMARDRSTGWRKTFFKTLALGFRGTEGEWRHLQTAMNIFAFAIIPVMFSVHTIVSWDFAMAMRPGWSSSVFGPYFVLGALHSGMGAVAVVLFLMRATMKHMDYFLRKEHFDALGKLMLIVTFAYSYFFFNDYIVQWYGGDKWTDALLHWLEEGPMSWMFYQLIFFNLAIPALTLWNQKIRQNSLAACSHWLVDQCGYVLGALSHCSGHVDDQPYAVYLEIYEPGIEIFLTIGTFSLFLVFYLAASRLIPLIPVWEVQEGQMTHSLRKVGKAEVPTVSEFE